MCWLQCGAVHCVQVPAEEGVVYLVCGVGTHCSLGNQKLAVTIARDC